MTIQRLITASGMIVLGASLLSCGSEDIQPDKIDITATSSQKSVNHQPQPQDEEQTTQNSSYFDIPDPRLIAASAGNGGEGVYIAGVGQNAAGVAVATYWKNDVAVNLASSQSYAYAIAVSGADVYVVGDYGQTATCWKNGVPMSLRPNNVNTHAVSVFAAGGDVYIAGSVAAPANGHTYAVYWKNGVAIQLTGEFTYSQALKVIVSGNDVYVAGSIYQDNKQYAAYWKNGNLTTLTDGSSYAIANSIAVSGSDVYVTITTNGIYGGSGIVTYWKNGIAINDPNEIVKPCHASSIAVSGSDVYVVGSVVESPLNSSVYAAAKYWKSGASYTLPMGYDGVNVDYASDVVVIN